MILCTECYIQKDDKTLMLYRNKKENDINKNKYIGIGGRFEHGESPEECLIREVFEETGLTLTCFEFRGMITFLTVNNECEPIYMFVFTADGFSGEVKDCDEGELHWVETERIEELNLWEGDHLMWKWLKGDDGVFSGKFVYDGNDLADDWVKFY
ncbi:MAG: 8-oxo-dGTP diphosphatase [Lachnospiraceae bacterium]|nr:8-oxo-dGTP diphosphatase [Lachnospiraceae bacterium]